MCLRGSLPFSNYCVSSLAAGFRFHLYSMCIPLPWNFNIGCCANEKPLRWIAHRRVRFFTFMFVSTLVLGAGGSSLNLIQALESIVILETHECTSSVTLARSSGTLCWTARGAREQQSLRTWIVSFFFGLDGIQLARSVGEWSLFWIPRLNPLAATLQCTAGIVLRRRHSGST